MSAGARGPAHLDQHTKQNPHFLQRHDSVCGKDVRTGDGLASLTDVSGQLLKAWFKGPPNNFDVCSQ